MSDEAEVKPLTLPAPGATSFGDSNCAPTRLVVRCASPPDGLRRRRPGHFLCIARCWQFGTQDFRWHVRALLEVHSAGAAVAAAHVKDVAVRGGMPGLHGPAVLVRPSERLVLSSVAVCCAGHDSTVM